MDETIKELRDKRVQASAKCTAITNVAVEEKRNQTPKETADINELTAFATELQGQIESQEADEAVARAESLADDLETAQPRKVRPDVRIGRTLRDKDPKLGFRDMGEFMVSVRNAGMAGQMADERLNVEAIAGLGTVVGADGGFLLPPEFSTAIWDGLNDPNESLLGMTDRFTITGDSLTVNANAETDRADGSRYGGVQGFWLEEGGTKTPSTPALRKIEIKPKKLAVLVYVTDELLQNSAAVSQWITRAAIDEIDFKVGDAIINGNGVGKPQGILNSGSVVSVDAENGQLVATLLSENILKMYTRLHRSRRMNAVWLINQDVEQQLYQMTIGVGTGGQVTYMPPGAGLSAEPFSRLMGLRIMPIEYCPTLGTTGDIILADMKGYVSGTRGGVASDMSIHVRFLQDETTFRFVFAVDGQPWLQTPLTPFKGTVTTSTFVTLASRT